MRATSVPFRHPPIHMCVRALDVLSNIKVKCKLKAAEQHTEELRNKIAETKAIVEAKEKAEAEVQTLCL